MFLKNKNIIFKIRRSKVTDYAALRKFSFVFKVQIWGLRGIIKAKQVKIKAWVNMLFLIKNQHLGNLSFCKI